MRGGGGGASVPFLVLLLFLSLPPLPLRGQVDPATLEDGLFELFVERIGPRTTLVTFVDPVGRVFIPLRPVLEHAGIPVGVAGGRWVLEWPRGVWRTELDATAGIVRVGDAPPRALPADAWLALGEEVYLLPEVLAALLEADVGVRWSDLMILVTGNTAFPAAFRTDAEADRMRARARARDGGPDPWEALPFSALSGGAALTWGLSVAGVEGEEPRGVGRLALGGSVLGGALEGGGGLAFGVDAEPAVRERFIRYTRPLRAGPWVRQMEMGSILPGGTLGRRLWGGAVSNDPLLPERYFGEAVISPAVPAGWEFEVYQGDFLVGISDGDDPAGLRAPLNYGNTPIRVRLLGPAGQVVEQELLYLVPAGRLRAGDLRYALGAGRCQDGGCDAYGWGEVRLGLLDGLTVGGGVDRFRPEPGVVGGEEETTPWATLVAAPLPSLAVDAFHQPGILTRGSLQWAASSRTTLSGSYAWSRPRDGVGLRVAGWQGQVALNTPLRLGGPRPFSIRLLLRGEERDRVGGWRATTSSMLGGAFLSVDWESGLQARDLVTARGFTPLIGRVKGLRDLSLTSSVGGTREGVELVEAGFSARPLPWGVLTGSVRLRRGEQEQFILGFTTRSRLGYTQARGASAARSSYLLAADGGLALNGPYEPLLLPFQSVGRAGVEGVVFQDLNGNGVWDQGEPPVPGVRVAVRGIPVVTDDRGRFRVWELQPWEATAAAVDSLSLDPGWVPSPRELVFRPAPNLFTPLALPVVRTRELAGGVVREPGGGGVGGVSVEFLDDEGAVVLTARTYSDGALYVDRIPPGTYRVRVGEASSRALGGRVEPSEIPLLVPFEGDDLIRVPLFRVLPAEPPPTGPRSPPEGS